MGGITLLCPTPRGGRAQRILAADAEILTLLRKSDHNIELEMSKIDVHLNGYVLALGEYLPFAQGAGYR